MKSLYLRIWLTVVAALALFALVSGWLVQRHLERERAQAEAALAERMQAWGEMIQASLPGPGAPQAQQAEALREWSRRLRVPLALHDAQGGRIAASDSYLRREEDGPTQRRAMSIHLDDGRTLWLMRPRTNRMGLPPPDLGGSGPPPGGTPDAGLDREGPPFEPPPHGGPEPGERPPVPPDALRTPREPRPPLEVPRVGRWTGAEFPPLDWSALVGLLALLFVAVAAGAYPVVRSLTKRLERLKEGVEAFGAGTLSQRVDAQGRDEVAAVAVSFNRAAERIEALVQTHQRLLANASHELRSPLARLKMAVALLTDGQEGSGLRAEIDANIAELDALVEEVLLSSRLDAGATLDLGESVDLLGLAAEEAARAGVQLDGVAASVKGNERLLRRALRNLIENALRYGGGEVHVDVRGLSGGGGQWRVCDRGAGVPEDQRERIFEPFYRLPGHAEREGGVGLGLSLVRQIAQRHGGQVHCEARDGGGSCFVLSLPGRAP